MLFALFALGAVVAWPALAQLSGTITLTGTISQQCSVVVTPSVEASNLNLSTGVRRVQVGTALQNCNQRPGFTLSVLSQNCATGTPGAKLIGTVNGETLRYSVEFNNPATGGSQTVVTGLLATACSGASAVMGRDVTNSKVSDETSTIYLNYSGDSSLASDSYTDTLTIVMTLK